MAMAGLSNGLSPQDMAVFTSSRRPIPPRDPRRTVRMWNINHIPEDQKINREHAIAVLGTVMNSEANIVSKIAEINHDKKHLTTWCTHRLKAMWIRIACNNGMGIDGRQPSNWSDVKEGIFQSMKVDGTANEYVHEVHYGWWSRVRWKQILEDEYMQEFNIGYYPTSLQEEGRGTVVTTIHKQIRRKFNDLNKDIQRYIRPRNGGEYLTSRKVQRQGENETGVCFTKAVKGSYVVQKHLPQLSPFTCDGSCKHTTDLREQVSVLEQQHDDLKRKHRTEITVSVNVLFKLVRVTFYLHLFFFEFTEFRDGPSRRNKGKFAFA